MFSFQRGFKSVLKPFLDQTRHYAGLSGTQNPLPASFLRGGTSKGIFINRSNLPEDQSQWGPIFLGIMGSPDPVHGRQLNGMGGGVSSLSKICVVGSPSSEQKAAGIDVEYTFVQVGIRDSSIDYSGNCGNLSSMIGAFALDEGLCSVSTAGKPTATIRSFNTNTKKIIDTTFPVSADGVADLDLPEATVAGVPGKASQIILEFVNPSGARTGKLLPSGSPTTQLHIPTYDRSITASLVDATNPTVFVTHRELSQFAPIDGFISGKQPATEEVSPILEAIRQQGAIAMGLDPSAQAQPKIAVLSHPKSSSKDDVDIVVHALSMGVLHRAVPMTVGLCLGVAAKTAGTLAWDIVQQSRSERPAGQSFIRIMHPSGIVDVGAEHAEDGSVKSAQVVRTGRRLMVGKVWW